MNPEILQAILAINAGNLLSAQTILENYLKNNLKDVDAWSCLYSCLLNNNDRNFCLERILNLDNNNEHAISELSILHKGGKTFTDFPVVANSKTDISTLPVINDITSKNEEEKPLPVYVTRRTIKYDYHIDDIRKKKPILRPKLNQFSIGYNPDTTDVLSYINSNLNMFDNIITSWDFWLLIKDAKFNPSDCPKCIERGYIHRKSQCNFCDYFSVFNCPIFSDPSILQDISPWLAQNKRYRQEILERRQIILDALYNELKIHGRPLHYEVLAKIMKGRHPRLRLNARMIVHLMSSHPEIFEWVDKGVYQAK